MRSVLIALVAAFCAATAHAQPKNPPLVIRHVTVIDVRAGKPVNDQTVVVENGRITTVATGMAVKMPAGTTAIDGTGKFLIPGLWDMHVHAAWPGLDALFAPLFVANGVTGVREMYGSPIVIAAWKQKYQKGEPWPRMIGSGHILDGPKPFWPGSTVAGNADEARAAVDKLHAGGADFIKVYTKLPRDAYFAALDEAKKVGTYCAGHVPDAVSVSEASDHGQRSVEHLTGVALECSSDAEALRAERAAAAADTSITNLIKTYSRQTERVLATQDPKRAADLFARLKRNQTWMVPTFTVLRSMSSMNDSAFAADPRIKYMPEQIASGWDWKKDFRFRAKTAEDWENGRKSYKLNMQIVGAMNKAGVPIMAGTDMLNPFTFPGFSLHDELSLLNEAGLTPAEALRAATLNPAIFMNATDSLGTVEKGKRADLVLLDANPLTDIHNTQKVNAVVLNGKLYDRAALDALMADEQKQARP
ncbi:MAG TPA: amidohydrolase family protein [Candidatus Krumholzibacteria bacterium]|nr:amidohydrolase family protein [Candidatus Krumholzibacteria bacterium]